MIEPPLVPDDTGVRAESDNAFGVDFPDLVDAPLISEEELIDEPVTSGTDSALAAIDTADAGPDANDEDGDEGDNEDGDADDNEESRNER